MRSSSVLLRALFSLGLLVLTAPLRAESAWLELEVPEACRAEALALSERQRPAQPPAGVKLAVERAGHGFRATVHTALGTRTLEGETCAAAVSAALVFVALSVAPATPAPPPELPAEPETAAVAEPAHDVDALSPPAQRRVAREELAAARERRSLTALISAAAGWATGALPGSGFGGGLRVSLGKGLWSGALGVLGWGRREARAAIEGTGGEFWLWSGLAAGCAARPEGRLRPAGCLGIDVGRMHGRGTGIDDSEHARALWAAAFAELQLRLSLHRGLQIFLSAQPQLTLVRRRFRLHGAGVVHQPDTFAFSASLGVSYEFSRP